MIIRWLATVANLAMLGLLAGCASPPRSAAADLSIHSVAIVTAVSEDVPLQRIGLTIFNNDYKLLPMKGELNAHIEKIASERLAASRPDWTVKRAGTDPGALSAKIHQVWNSWGSKDGPLSDQLPGIAQLADVEALLVIEEARSDTASGVSVVMRALPGLEPRVGANVVLRASLVDRQGHVLSSRFIYSVSPAVAAKDLGMNDQLSTALDPVIADRLRHMLKTSVSTSLQNGLSELGY